jgi:UDP-N-acetyl-alpha-D-muramoyl-L-alanyl-L-glutamate epimerase
LSGVFSFTSYTFDEQNGLLSFRYTVQNDGESHSFEEKYIFDTCFLPLSEEKRKVLDRVFFLFHIAAGISYYKAFVSDTVSVDSGRLTQEEASFFTTFYFKGLGEFFCRNDLPLKKIDFPFKAQVSEPVLKEKLKKRCLLPIGGGKDSALSLELLKESFKKEDILPVSCGMVRPIAQTIQASGLPSSLLIRREISPNLIALNKEGKVFNGHVPVTGIFAFLLLACGILYDYAFVVMSCEKSANAATRLYKGEEVNHQWSKSFEFESLFNTLSRKLVPDFSYFSLLRPLSELKIAYLFSKYGSPYFPVFTSCNKAFKLDKEKRLDRWCADCDKCRFVFLCLAAFMDKETLIKIFGKNMLDDETQEKGFKELLGLSGYKPFECVGEVDESRLAFLLLCEREEFQNDVIVKKLKDKISFQEKASLYQRFFSVEPSCFIPAEFQNVVQRFKE